MTIEEKLKMYREKRQFIHGVSMAFIKVPGGHSVDGVVYEVFFQEFTEPYHVDITEWVTVQYNGGAEAHKCVSGNSNAANFEVVASMVHGGCYEQNRTYESLTERGYRKLDLNKMFSFTEVK
jgi:hypothetical protein